MSSPLNLYFQRIVNAGFEEVHFFGDKASQLSDPPLRFLRQ